MAQKQLIPESKPKTPDVKPEAKLPEKGFMGPETQSQQTTTASSALEERKGALLEGLAGERLEGMQWLIDHLSEEQLMNTDPKVLREHLETAYRAREELPFASQLNEEEFRNFVLNPVIIDEQELGGWRAPLYEMVREVVKNAGTVQEAAELVDRWVFEQLHPNIGVDNKTPDIWKVWAAEQRVVHMTAAPALRPAVNFLGREAGMVPFRPEMEYEALTTKLTTAALRSVGIGASPTFINSWNAEVMASGGGATWTTFLAKDSLGRTELVPIGAPNFEGIAMQAGSRVDASARGWWKDPLFTVAGDGGAGTKVWMIDSLNARAHEFNGVRVMDLTADGHYMAGRTGTISVKLMGITGGTEGALVELVVPDKDGWTAVDSTRVAFWGGQEFFENVGANPNKPAQYAVRVSLEDAEGNVRLYAKTLGTSLTPGQVAAISITDADLITGTSPQRFGPRTEKAEFGVPNPGEIIWAEAEAREFAKRYNIPL